MYTETSFEGKVALVTGSGNGIGYAIGLKLMELGAKVIFHYHSQNEKLLQLQHIYGNDQCHVVQADFSSSGDVLRMFSDAWQWQDKIDILVNNAALIDPVSSITKISEDDLQKTMQINFFAPFLLMKMLLENSQNTGEIIRIASISSIAVKYSGSPQMVHYMASKAALESGTLALAKHSSSSILANVLRVGVTNTDAHKRLGRDDLSARESLIPIGRAAEPEEIADVVIFLVSPLNTYLTGAIVPVAGGE